ncbi:Rpn family recombination-promoting nuclease/putative transposase [Desulfosporosinus sp. BG]|uniref:Rpn family recombination-promoting nuclease/putative transposase n=1 Tax=Desulfosporosinus sp. BG TaxID=1633135 RepID=UPI000839F2C4|nr:Rpn family recombination-promoting nuclease/putative transposase [Desulfosporosinus sp. BG]ODA40465.1 Branched-chain amino acid transport ATP-binding protein LivG [Desulfosporosinus sp. BG]
MKLLETKKLTKTFGGLTAVSQVDMHVDSGEILGLIGPNGAGKTTFFNLISGLYQPTAGEIIFQNQTVHGFKGYQMAEAGIARTFQNIRLLSSLSVLENVLLGSYTRGKAGLWGAILKGKRVKAEEKRVRQESMEQLELVGLQDYAHQPAGVLSYGQQRKLEIARALAIYPALLLLDEPTAGMNAEEVAEIMSLVRYLKSHNKTKQIDIEIQILPTEFMPERTMFYWSKMYTSQVKSGDTYSKLKKCITINIVDFQCTPLQKLYSSYHLTEDETGYRLTDILEVHFLEIIKLANMAIPRDENDRIVEWMEFLDAKSKGVIEMLAEKNKDIKKAYDLLQIISKDEKARMLYDAREAELRDQLTRIEAAENKGKAEGKAEVAKNLLDLGMEVSTVAKVAGMTEEEVKLLKD